MIRARTLAWLSVALTLAGCGGGGSSTPTNPNPPTGVSSPPPSSTGTATRTVIDTRQWSLRGGAGVFYNQDKLPPGTIDVIMDWQNGDHPMALYLTNNTCPGTTDLLAGRCQVLAQPETNSKPLRLSYQLTAKSTNVSVWVVDTSRQGDAGTLEVGLTTDQPYTPPTPVPSDGNIGDYRNSLPDGPVASVFIKVRSIDTGNQNYRDPFQDSDGNWILYNGEFVVFDATQKNGNGQECKWINNPKWTVYDPGYVFVIKGSSQPFLLRADVTKDEGTITIQCDIDGIDSNIINVKVVKKS